MSEEPQDEKLTIARDLARQVAGRFRTLRRVELEVELAHVALKNLENPPPDKHNLHGYIYQMLFNLGLKRVREWRRREAVEEPFDEGLHVTQSPSREFDAIDVREALSRLGEVLDQNLRQFIAALIRNDYKVGRASDECGIHRNTGTAYLRVCREKLEALGFCTERSCAKLPPPSPLPVEGNVPNIDIANRSHVVTPGRAFILVPTLLVEWLASLPLSGTEFRIALWVIRNTYGWHRGSVGFSWYGIAQALKMDRGGTVRAGRKLVTSAVLVFTEVSGTAKRRIGFPGRFPPPNAKISMSPVIAECDVGKHLNRCQPTSVLRRAKDSSKDKNNNKTGGKPPQGENRQAQISANRAGAAKPVPGKYRNVES